MIHIVTNEFASDSKPKARLAFTKANYDEIGNALDQIDWGIFFSHCVTVQQFWNSFFTLLSMLIFTFVPVITPKNCFQKWPKSIRSLDTKQRRLWKKYRQHRTYANRDKWKTAAKNSKNAKKSEILRHEQQITEQPNIKKFWNYVNSKMKFKPTIPCLKTMDGRTITSDFEKANLFNEYFHSVFTADDGRALPAKTVNFPKLSNMTFPPELVYNYLRSLKNNHSSGVDNIPSLFFKKLSFQLALPLSFIFNFSFQTGEIPFDWLRAKVTPIHKNKGSTQEVCNYRPISLTPPPCKVMERLVRDKLLTHFSNNNLSSKQQHGFLARKSTSTQLLQCINDWSKTLDNKGWVDVIYLDIAKAFDSVSHTKLLRKLENSGITGRMLNWIAAFLSNRSQTVHFNDCTSNAVPVTSGVPQGSVLGPILFLIYINDLPDVVKNCKIKLFADDSKIYFMGQKGESSNSLQTDLERVFEWCNSVQLSIAFNKSAVLHFGATHNPHSDFVINNYTIPSVTEMKDLGIIMSSDFKFKKHCNHIAKKTRILFFMVFIVVLSHVTHNSFLTCTKLIVGRN